MVFGRMLTLVTCQLPPLVGPERCAEVQITQVRDDGQFVFLLIGQCIFNLDIKCRALCKVYENTVNGPLISDIHSFMMIWPPTFSALKDDPTRFAFWSIEIYVVCLLTWQNVTLCIVHRTLWCSCVLVLAAWSITYVILAILVKWHLRILVARSFEITCVLIPLGLLNNTS
jgi:hypothetical protein